MKVYKNRIIHLIIYFFFIFNIFVFLNQNLNQRFYNKKLYVNIVIIGLFWIFYFQSWGMKNKNVTIPYIVMKTGVLILIIINYVFGTFGIRSSINDLISVLFALLVFSMCSSIHFSDSNYRVLWYILYFGFIILLLQSRGYYKYFMREYYNGNTAVINSNTIGFLLLFLCITLCALINTVKKWTLSIVVINITTFWGILQTKSRAVLIAFIIWSILYSFPFKWYKNKKFVLIILSCELIICNLMPYILINIFNKVSIAKFSLLGKGIDSGRRQLWEKFFYMKSLSKFNGFFGIDSTIGDVENKVLRGSMLHNSYLNIQFSFGILGACIFIVAIILFFLKLYKLNELKKQQVVLIIGFFAILINCCFETYLLYSMITPFIYSLLGIMYSLGRGSKNAKEN